MHATFPQTTRPHDLSGSSMFSVRVGATACSVRAFPLAAIQELLGFEDEIEAIGAAAADPDLFADAVESRMITPPRPRRRRQRAVSSRAVFFGG